MSKPETKYANIHEALAACQGELQNPEKTKTAKAGSYTYKYADIADVLNACRPVLSKHGIAVIQATVIEGDVMLLKTCLTYVDGTSVDSLYPVCSFTNGDHQKIGAAMTYARRYALSSLLGIASEEDSDGQGAAKTSGASQMSVHQAKKEINWDNIVGSIRNAKTMKLLDNMAVRVNESEGIWPTSYTTSARDEIEARRKELESPPPADEGEAIPQWDNYDDKIAALVQVLKSSPADIQGEIWEAELINERFEAGLIFPPDMDKLKGMIKDA